METSTFIFLLTMWNPETNMSYVDVEDVLANGPDCAAAMAQYHKEDPAWSRGVPSCEINMGELEESLSTDYAVSHNGEYLIIQPCRTKDSDNCIWDARWRDDGEGTGKGTGESFYVVDGVVYSINTKGWE